jgi:hypothetical protein
VGPESERVMAIMKRGCKYDAFWKRKDDYVDMGSRIMIIVLEWVSQKMVIFVKSW